MFNDDDFMGGFFDFDGNGKTTLDEQYVAYKIYEETTKEEKNNVSSQKPVFSHNKPHSTPVKKNISFQKPIPAFMTIEEYQKRRRLFFRDVIISLVVAMIMWLPLGVVIWASISAYDQKNSASGFITLIVSLIAIAGIIIICKELFSGIAKSYEHLQKEKEVFYKTATEDEKRLYKKKHRKTLIISVCIIGAIIVIVSLILTFINSTSNKDNNNLGQRKSYSYSSSTSYPSRTSSTSTTSKPYSSSSSYSSYSSSSKSKSYSSRSKSGSKSKDEYNAKDYYHAEDFYEDHYDDFYDYEDAEDYFNDHHDD